jgi:amidohydrolase
MTGADELLVDSALVADMIAARRHLHAHPELSNAETETQAFIRQWLGARGLDGARTVATTGLAVDIVGEAGSSNRRIAIRADIDALPIEETSGVPFASRRGGVMHACGHDAHTAMALAAAAALQRSRARFAGSVRFIFEPAEEAEPLGGRRIVLEEGLLEDVDAVIGIHVDPYLETGKIAVAPGPYTLAADNLDVTVHGRSAHAAKPAEGIDAIAIAATLVTELQKLVARETDAFDPLIVSVTGIEGGGSYNIIADRVTLKGTIRSGRPETRRRAHRRLSELAEGIAASHGGRAEVRITEGEPSVLNDAEVVALVEAAGRGLIGAENVLALPGWTVADDFGFYSEKRPAAYFRLGIRNEDAGSIHPLHHPGFRVDEAALTVGANLLIRTALEFFERRG